MWNMVIRVRRWPWLPKIHPSYLLLPFIPSKTLYKTTAILFSYNLALGIQRRDSGDDVSACQRLGFQMGELEWLGVTWPGGEETTGVENSLWGWLPYSCGTWPGMTWRPGSPGAVDNIRPLHRARAVTGWQFLESGCSRHAERELTGFYWAGLRSLSLTVAAFCWLQASHSFTPL